MKKTVSELNAQYKKMRNEWFKYILNRDGYLTLQNQRNEHLNRALRIIVARSKEELAKLPA